MRKRPIRSGAAIDDAARDPAYELNQGLGLAAGQSKNVSECVKAIDNAEVSIGRANQRPALLKVTATRTRFNSSQFVARTAQRFRVAVVQGVLIVF